MNHIIHRRCSKTNVSYAFLESAMIKFLSRCCWCHRANQKLLAELLMDVISQQRTTSSKYPLYVDRPLRFYVIMIVRDNVTLIARNIRDNFYFLRGQIYDTCTGFLASRED